TQLAVTLRATHAKNLVEEIVLCPAQAPNWRISKPGRFFSRHPGGFINVDVLVSIYLVDVSTSIYPFAACNYPCTFDIFPCKRVKLDLHNLGIRTYRPGTFPQISIFKWLLRDLQTHTRKRINQF